MLDRGGSQLDHMEQVANWITDNDREWWPFLFLRPREDERMTSPRVFVLAVLYGVFAGMLGNIAIALMAGEAGARVSFWQLPLCTSFAFFVVYRCTFAYFWNRRAERLLNSRVPIRHSR